MNANVDRRFMLDVVELAIIVLTALAISVVADAK